MSFIKEDFLLQNKYAQELYHNYAAALPIIDYHNHLDPAQLATDHRFENLTQAWLAHDHYKWRAMRALGVSEKYITGSATDYEKFLKWAEMVPYTVRNPLYHWTHLELKRYFGVDGLLSAHNAQNIYNHASSKLQEKSFSALGLLQQMKVEVVCTTDDPVDDLAHHKKAAADDTQPKVLPTFRPDQDRKSVV